MGVEIKSFFRGLDFAAAKCIRRELEIHMRFKHFLIFITHFVEILLNTYVGLGEGLNDKLYKKLFKKKYVNYY